MTTAQRLSQIFGWVFVLAGVGGFFATGMSMDPNPETAPHLLGMFPVNVPHNLVHLAFGLWGIAGSRSYGGARAYLYGAGAIYLLLAAVGFIAPTGFGLVPLGGNDIALHVFLSLGLLLAAFATARRRAHAT